MGYTPYICNTPSFIYIYIYVYVYVFVCIYIYIHMYYIYIIIYLCVSVIYNYIYICIHWLYTTILSGIGIQTVRLLVSRQRRLSMGYILELTNFYGNMRRTNWNCCFPLNFQTTSYIWRFHKSVVPLNHPFLENFSIANQPF